MSRHETPVPVGREALTIGEVGRRDGVEVRVPADAGEDAPLMTGRFLRHEFGDGLSLHGGDLIEEQPFDIRSQIPPGLSCIFFLEGQVEARIGDRSFAFGAASDGPVDALTVMTTDHEAFRRHTSGRQRVRHLVIHATPHWLVRHGAEAGVDGSEGRRLPDRNVAGIRWSVPREVTALLHALVGPAPSAGPGTDPIHRLRTEARTMQVLAEALDRAMTGQHRPSPTALRRARALSRAKEFIDAQPAADLTVRDIARAAAISVSGLQSVFREYENCGVIEFVRRSRLDRAHAALTAGTMTVEAASALAGYAHPANFATAYKRQFAAVPSRA